MNTSVRIDSWGGQDEGGRHNGRPLKEKRRYVFPLSGALAAGGTCTPPYGFLKIQKGPKNKKYINHKYQN
jgi:hypothetical protein